MPIFYPDGREATTIAEMREALPSVPPNECFGCYLGDCAPEMHDIPDACQYFAAGAYVVELPPDDAA